MSFVYTIMGDGQRLYLESESTATAFGIVAATGRVVVPGLTVFSLGPDSGERARGVGIVFLGSGANNSTFDARIYVVHRGYGYAKTVASDFDIALYGTATVTLGAMVGAGSPVTTVQRLADTITYVQATSATTPQGVGGSTVLAHGGVDPVVYSPGNDLCATLWIPELGNAHGIILDFDLTGATGANALIERMV